MLRFFNNNNSSSSSNGNNNDGRKRSGSLQDGKENNSNTMVMIQGMMEIKGTMHRAISSYEFGSPVITSLVAIKGNDDDKYYISFGKVKISLLPEMDTSPKCFSIMTNDDDEPGVITIRTKESDKVLYLRLPDSNSFSQWQILLGEAIANVISMDAIKLQPTGRVSSSNILSALTVCNLLTSTNNPAIIKLRTLLRMRHLMSEIIQRLNISPHLVAQTEVESLIIEADEHPILSQDVDLSFLKSIREKIYDKEALAAISYEIQLEETSDPITYGWTAATIAAVEDKDMIINELSEKEKLLNAELSDITAAFAVISEKAVDVEIPIISTDAVEHTVTTENNNDTNDTENNNENNENNGNNAKIQSSEKKKKFFPTVIASLSPFSSSSSSSISSRMFTSPFSRSKNIIEIDDKHVSPIGINMPLNNDDVNADVDVSKTSEVALPVPLLPALRDMNKPKVDKTVSFDVNEKENKKEVISKDMIKGRRPLSNISNNIDQVDHSKVKKKSPISAPSHVKRKIIPSPTNTTNTMGFNVTTAVTSDIVCNKADTSIPVGIKPSTDIKELIQLYQPNSSKSQPSNLVSKKTDDVPQITQTTDTSSLSSTSTSTSKDNMKSHKKIATLITILSVIIACLSLTYSLSHPRVQSLDEALYFKNGKLDLEKVKFTKQIYDGMPTNMPKGLRQESAKLATYKVYKSKNDDDNVIQKKETLDNGIKEALHFFKKIFLSPFRIVGEIFSGAMNFFSKNKQTTSNK